MVKSPIGSGLVELVLHLSVAFACIVRRRCTCLHPLQLNRYAVDSRSCAAEKSAIASHRPPQLSHESTHKLLCIALARHLCSFLEWNKLFRFFFVLFLFFLFDTREKEWRNMLANRFTEIMSFYRPKSRHLHPIKFNPNFCRAHFLRIHKWNIITSF